MQLVAPPGKEDHPGHRSINELELHMSPNFLARPRERMKIAPPQALTPCIFVHDNLPTASRRLCSWCLGEKEVP